MNKPLVINKVAEQMGLTSRTLRHWESENLFSSIRDVDSGWRTYDENAILCIQITALLRKIDIPIKEIKAVVDCMNISKLYEVILNQIMVIDNESAEIIFKKKQLEQLLSFLSKRSNLPINDEILYQIQVVNRNFENILKEHVRNDNPEGCGFECQNPDLGYKMNNPDIFINSVL